MLYYVRNCVIIGVACLTMCEECLWVLGCTACDRALRSEGTLTEVLDVSLVNERTDVFHVHHLNLVILVRGAETVEEVDERNVCLESRKVRNSCEVHHFLY